MKALAVIALALVLQACGDGNSTAQAPGLDTLRGQWVVINYWARWCKPCIEEIPELNALNTSRDDLTVLGVNYDGIQGEELARQEAELGVEFTTLPEDPAAQLNVPRPVVLPTTFVVNPAGEIVATLLGPQTLETLTSAIETGNPTR